jgi:hypothetical protein
VSEEPHEDSSSTVKGDAWTIAKGTAGISDPCNLLLATPASTHPLKKCTNRKPRLQGNSSNWMVVHYVHIQIGNLQMVSS